MENGTHCCKKSCSNPAVRFSWLCQSHLEEWEASPEGKSCRDFTIKATTPGLDEFTADAYYDTACELYKRYIMS